MRNIEHTVFILHSKERNDVDLHVIRQWKKNPHSSLQTVIIKSVTHPFVCLAILNPDMYNVTLFYMGQRKGKKRELFYYNKYK